MTRQLIGRFYIVQKNLIHEIFKLKYWQLLRKSWNILPFYVNFNESSDYSSSTLTEYFQYKINCFEVTHRKSWHSRNYIEFMCSKIFEERYLDYWEMFERYLEVYCFEVFYMIHESSQKKTWFEIKAILILKKWDVFFIRIKSAHLIIKLSFLCDFEVLLQNFGHKQICILNFIPIKDFSQCRWIHSLLIKFLLR